MPADSPSQGLALILYTRSILGLLSFPSSSGTHNLHPKIQSASNLLFPPSRHYWFAPLMLFTAIFVTCIPSVRQPSTTAVVTYFPRQTAWCSSFVTETCTGGFTSSEAQVYRSQGCSSCTASYVILLAIIFYSVPLNTFIYLFISHACTHNLSLASLCTLFILYIFKFSI